MPRRKRRSFGSIRTLPSGRHQAHFTHPDGERIKAPETFETYGDAEGWLRTQERELALGIWVHPDEREKQAERTALTVGQWLDQFHDIKETEIELGTVQGYRNRVRLRITEVEGEAAALRDIALVKLGKADVYAWWDAVSRQFPSTETANHQAYKQLRAACAAAVDRGLIEVNPVDIKAASKTPEPKNKELATAAELSAIVDTVYPRYRVLAVLCLFHGLRIGEATALTLANVTVSKDPRPGPWLPQVTVRVSQNFQWIKNKEGKQELNLTTPKTKAGYRDVPIFEEFVPDLLDHMVKFSGEDLLTVTRAGQPVLPHGLRSALDTAKRKAGVRMEITPHYGRNWLITHLAEQGATPAEIGSVLGQEDMRTILNVYMKARPDRARGLMRKVGESEL